MTGSRPELCVGAVACRGDEVLLVRRGTEPERGRWSVPGGRVEPGETLAEAVLRELHEETGLDALCGPLMGWVERIGDRHHFVILDFEVTVVGGEPARPGDDVTEVAWVDRHAVTDRALVSGLAEFLADHGVIELIC